MTIPQALTVAVVCYAIGCVCGSGATWWLMATIARADEDPAS